MSATACHYGRWEQWELDTLHRKYPSGGYKHVGRLLPHRSLDTIRMRASALGIRAPRASGPLKQGAAA